MSNGIYDPIYWQLTSDGHYQLRDEPLDLNYPVPAHVAWDVVYGYENQFKGTLYGGSLPHPAQLKVTTEELEATFIVFNSQSDTINTIAVSKVGGTAWDDVGSVEEDGELKVSLDPGHYWGRVHSRFTATTEPGGITSVPLRFSLFAGTKRIIHSPSHIFWKLLQDFSWFSDPLEGMEWPVFVSNLPDTELIRNDAAVYDTSGIKDGRLMDSGRNIYHYGVQLRLRSMNYIDGWERSQTICSELEQQGTILVELEGREHIVLNVSQTSQILPLGGGGDPRRRYEFSVNFLLTIQEEN